MLLNINYRDIQSKEALIELITHLKQQDIEGWENRSTMEFITALSAWLEDAEGFYCNNNIDIDSREASWQLFADALQAALIYE